MHGIDTTVAMTLITTAMMILLTYRLRATVNWQASSGLKLSIVLALLTHNALNIQSIGDYLIYASTYGNPGGLSLPHHHSRL